MNVDVYHADGRSRVVLKGRFDFTAHRSFKQACEGALSETSTSEIVIDMHEVEYLDSSALGMLLLLRDKAKDFNKNIVLNNCAGNVKEVLRVANFDKLFNVT